MAVIFYHTGFIAQFCSVLIHDIMANELKNSTKKEIAKDLFLTGKYQQKEIAKKVGSAENTIGRWVREGKWELLRANLTTTKESVLSNWYAQLAEMNKDIEGRDDGKRFPTPSESDRMIKIASAINKLESETGISEVSSVCIKVCEFTRKNIGLEKAQEINKIFDAVIEDMMK
jgi:transposase